MTFRQLYESAVKQVCEDPAETADYEDRAGYIFGTFCTRAMYLDRRYRAAHNLGAAGEVPLVCADLDGEFPFCDVFAPCAVLYLAPVLVMDENEEMSMRLFEQYADSISTIQKDLPCQRESIASHYDVTKG